MKKRILLIVIFVIVITFLICGITRIKKEKSYHYKIIEGDVVYINSIEELHDFEGFEDIKLKASRNIVTDLPDEGEIHADFLEIE